MPEGGSASADSEMEQELDGPLDVLTGELRDMLDHASHLVRRDFERRCDQLEISIPTNSLRVLRPGGDFEQANDSNWIRFVLENDVGSAWNTQDKQRRTYAPLVATSICEVFGYSKPPQMMRVAVQLGILIAEHQHEMARIFRQSEPDERSRRFQEVRASGVAAKKRQHQRRKNIALARAEKILRSEPDLRNNLSKLSVRVHRACGDELLLESSKPVEVGTVRRYLTDARKLGKL